MCFCTLGRVILVLLLSSMITVLHRLDNSDLWVCQNFIWQSWIYLPFSSLMIALPSVLWCCWLGGRKGIRPVKKLEWCNTGMVICLERDADLHMAQLMPLPLTVSCFSKIQIGFTFLVPAHPGSPGKRAFKCVCVCVCYDRCIPVHSHMLSKLCTHNRCRMWLRRPLHIIPTLPFSRRQHLVLQPLITGMH